jgi:hypothetical protein
MERLKLAETQAVILKIYAAYKPQIKAARARYLANIQTGKTNNHPDRCEASLGHAVE